MPIRANLNTALRFGVPGGYPFMLKPHGENVLEGVLPKGLTTITAELQAEVGTAAVHLAIFGAPATSGGVDGVEVARTNGTVTTERQSHSLTIPAGNATALVPYVVRLWVDGIDGRVADAADHDPPTVDLYGVAQATYDADPGAYNPSRPSGVVLHSFAVT